MTATAFPLIEASGPPRERGRQIGRQSGERILRSIGIYQDALQRNGITWDEARKIATRFLPRLEKFDFALTEEIHGIANGCDRPVEDIIALNARTELLYDSGLHEDPTPDGCTGAIALPEMTIDRHLLHGQNWDWLDACKNSAVVIRIEREDGSRLLTFVEAGIVGRAGMNSHGLAVTGNFLACPQPPATNAVPVPLIRRKALESSGLAEAMMHVMRSPRSFPANIMISDAVGEAIDLETTPQEVFWEKPERGLLVHANHFRTDAARARVIDTGLARNPDSLYRDSRVERRLRQSDGNVSRADMEAAFADTYGAPLGVLSSPTIDSDSGEEESYSTVATIIMDTTIGSMWVAPTPYAGEITFTEYRLDG
jgi:isopenicillin-N N-acyltransferase-like protein